MTSLFLTFVFSAATLGQVDGKDAEDKADEAARRDIRIAVKKLGSRDFNTRDEASKSLWRHGIKARSALERALKSTDGETRLRARKLLRDFDYGILPTATEEMRTLIRQFRDGTPNNKQQAFQRLLDKGKFKAIERLIRLEKEPDFRRGLLNQLVQHPKAVDGFLELDRIETLIDAVAADQNADWRKMVSRQLMFAPKVLEHLAEKKQLAGVLKLIKEEKEAALRNQMMRQLFTSQATVALVIEQKQLNLLFDVLKAEPDKAARGQLLSILIANNVVAQKLVELGKISEITKFAEEHVSAEARHLVFQRLLQSPVIAQSLLKDGGVDGMIKFVSREKDAATRGKLMAAALASSAIRNQMRGRAFADLIAKVTKLEKEAAGRREFLQSLLSSNNLMYSLNDIDSLRVLWKLVRAEDDRAWQAKTIPMLMRSYRAYTLLADKKEATWVFELLQDKAAAPVRYELLSLLVNNQQTVGVLVGQGRFDAMLAMVKEQSDANRPQILTNLLANPAVAQELIAKKKLDSLITLVREEKHAPARDAALQGIFRNHTAMASLIQAGKYETLHKLADETEPPQQRGLVLGDFVNGNGVLDQIAKRDSLDLLLKYCKMENEGGRKQFRGRMFQNQNAINLLMGKGHFDDLLAMAKEDKGDFLDELLAVAKVVDHLLANKEFKPVLEFAVKTGNDNSRRSLVQRLMSNQEVVKKLIAAERFEPVFALVKAEPDPNQRASLLSPVLSSPDVLRYFAKNDKLGSVFDLIAQEQNPNTRNQILYYLTSRTESVAVFVEHDKLDAILDAIKKYAEPTQRNGLLVRVLVNPKTLQKLKADKRVGLLLSFALHKENVQATHTYTYSLLSNDAALTVLLAEGYFNQVLALGREQPDERRGQVLGILLRSQAVAQHLQKAGDVNLLIGLVQQEKHEATRLACLHGVFANYEAIPHLLRAGQYQTLRAFIDEQKDPIQRASLFGAFLNARTAIQEIAKNNEIDLVFKYAQDENDAARKQFLPRMFQNQAVLSALVDKGHYDKLVSIAKQDNGAFLDELLVVPQVIQRMIAGKDFDALLKAAIKQADANARRNLLQNVLRNNDVVKKLVASKQLETVLELVKSETEPYWRGSLLGSILSSPDVVKYFAENDKLGTYFELLSSGGGSSNPFGGGYNSALSNLINRRETINALLEHDGLEQFVESIKMTSAGQYQGNLLGQLMTNQATVQWLKRKKKIDFLLTVIGADDEDAQARSVYLTRILAYTTTVNALIAGGHFEKMVSLAKKQPDNMRGQALRGLLANRSVAQHLVNAKKIDSLLTIVQEDKYPLARQAALSGVFSNSTAMPLLIKAGHYKTFRKEIDAVEDPAQRGALFGDFLNGRGVLEEVVKQGDSDLLLEYAKTDNDKARQQFLQRLFRNRNAIGLLIEKGKSAELISFAKQDNGALMDELLIVPQMIKHLAETKQFELFTTFASKTADDNTRRNVLQQVIYHEESMSVIVKADQFDALLGIIKLETDANNRGSMIGQAFASPSVIGHFVKAKKLNDLVELVRSDATVRDRIAASILNRSDTIGLFVDNEALDTLLAIVSQHSDDSTRGQLIGRAMTSGKTIEKLKSQKKIARVLTIVDELDSPAAVQNYMSIVLGHSYILDALLADGHYDKLFKLATTSKNATNPFAARAQNLSRLFARNTAVAELLKAKQLPQLIRFAEETGEAGDRRRYLTTFFSNEQLVNAIVEQKQFDKLLALCRADPDEALRNRSLTTLMLSSRAIEQIDKEELAKLVQLAVNDSDSKHRQAFLQKLFARSDAMNRLAEAGHFETIFAAIEKDLNSSSRYSFLSSALRNPDAMARLAKANVLMKLIEGISDDNRRMSLMQRLVNSRSTMQSLVEAGHLESILEYLKSAPSAQMRSYMLGNVLGLPATIEYLAKKDDLDFLFKAIEAETDRQVLQRCMQTLVYDPQGQRILAEGKFADKFVVLLKKLDDRYRRGYLIRVLTNPLIRQKWIAIGKVDKLKELAALYPDKAYRELYTANIRYSPSGMLGHLLNEGELERAEQLLREDEGDLGMTMLAAHLAIEGRLDAEIETVRKRFDVDGEKKDARLLTYLLRAKGDPSAAQEMAEKVGDPRLLRPLAVERRDWKTAATLQAASLALPPVSVAYSVTSDDQRRVEQLGLLASYQRLGGQSAEFEQTIREIKEFAETNKANKELGWNCAEMLLLNDQFDAGLELAARTKPIRAYNLYSARHEYDKALTVMGWEAGTLVNREWYDALVAEGPSASQIAVSRFESGIRVAKTLRFVGNHEEAEKVLKFLDEFAMDINPTGNYPQRNSYLEFLSGGLYRMGLTKRAFGVGARTVNPSSSYPNLLNRLFVNNTEVRHWWVLLKLHSPHDSVEERLMKLHRIVKPVAAEPKELFDRLVARAMEHGATITDPRTQPDYWQAIGSGCKRLGRTEAAKTCFAKIPDHVPAMKALANLLAAEEQWQEAAQLYEKTWQQDHGQVGSLYLAGDALIRSGQEDRGKELQQQADRLAVQGGVRHTLALDLFNRGLKDEAMKQWNTVTRLAPFENWNLNEAARRLGDDALSRDTAQAADLWQQYVLGSTRVIFRFNEDKYYLRLPLLIHKMRALAAIDAKDWEAVARHITIASDANPGDTDLAEELVPILDRVARTAEADLLANKVVDHFRNGVAQHPTAAFHHNNLAWAAARCHRHLDLAMQHATKAIELAPKNGSYIDTLAEVHFHLGDREKAIEFSERAVKLRPTASLRKQLERFRKDPLPK